MTGLLVYRRPNGLIPNYVAPKTVLVKAHMRSKPRPKNGMMVKRSGLRI